MAGDHLPPDSPLCFSPLSALGPHPYALGGSDRPLWFTWFMGAPSPLIESGLLCLPTAPSKRVNAGARPWLWDSAALRPSCSDTLIPCVLTLSQQGAHEEATPLHPTT